MVQIKNCFSQGCEITVKSDLRRSLDAVDNLDASSSTFGNQESHHSQQPVKQQQPTEADQEDQGQVDVGEKIVNDVVLSGLDDDGGTLLPKTRYRPDQILALKDSPLAKVKPDCVDDKPYWVGNVYPKKNITGGGKAKNGSPVTAEGGGNQRIGSGRLVPGTGESLYRPFRERTGREFAEEMIKRQNGDNPSSDLNVGYFNPVNQDHRRLVEENNEEKEPEWMHSGPESRFDTIELRGFDENEVSRFKRAISPPPKRNTSNSSFTGGKEKYGTPFTFDEFNNPRFGQTQNNRQGHNTPNSRFKTYFPRDNFNQAPQYFQQQQQFQHQQAAKHNKDDIDSNNNAAANFLLSLLHGQCGNGAAGGGGGMKLNHLHHMAYNNLSQMPSVEELEARVRHDQHLLNQFQINKQILAGKNVVDVLNVYALAQQRQQLEQQQKSPRPILKNRIEQPPMARAFEIQRQLQGHNPSLNPYNPQYWEMINQRQQAYYEQYGNQHPNQNRNPRSARNHRTTPRRMSHDRHVHFENHHGDADDFSENKLSQFFNNPNIVGQQMPSVDLEKALKVEEFERKIKATVANDDGMKGAFEC